jgi:hypothetical protein
MLWTRFAGPGEGSRNARQCDSRFIITLKIFLIAPKGVYRMSGKKAGKRLFGIPLLTASLVLSFTQKFALSVVTIFALIVEK